MKKTLIYLYFYCLFCCQVYGQSIEIDEKRYQELNDKAKGIETLKVQKVKDEKIVKTFKKELDSLKKYDLKIIQSKGKDLKKEISNLEKQNINLPTQASINELNTQKEKIETEINDLKNTNTQESIKKRKVKIEELSNQIEEKKQVIAKRRQNKEKIEELNESIKNKEDEIKNKEDEIKKLINIDSDIKSLKENIRSSQNDSTNIQKEIQKQENDINGLEKLSKENEEAKTVIKALESNIKSTFNNSVENYIKSPKYELSKTDRLLSYCDNPDIITFMPSEITNIKGKLIGYKKLSSAIHHAQQTISNSYEKTKVKNVFNELQEAENLDIVTEQQKKDIEKYKNLLQKYCDMNVETYIILNTSNSLYDDGYPDEAQKELKKLITGKPQIKEYPYLISEINKSLANHLYRSPIKESKCD